MSLISEEGKEVKEGREDKLGTPEDSHNGKHNQVGTVMLFGVPIVSLVMDAKERLCLAQISSTLLKEFSYNEIHNRRVALGITCIQCTPVQLEILRRAGAMPVTSRRCGMITRREAERLCQSFLGDHAPPQLPENFAFDVYHQCAWGCRGAFVPSRYNSSRAKCIRCSFCQLFFSPNKFIFHSHRLPDSTYVQPDAANFNSWRRHLKLCGDPPDEVSPDDLPRDRRESSSLLATAQIVHHWEDVKAMFNGGTRKRLLAAHSIPASQARTEVNGGQRRPSKQQAANPNSDARPPPTFPPNSCVDSNGGFSPSPLLSPVSVSGGIWNPGVIPPGRQIPPPFHQLSMSLPWLNRRPLFPFSHPFGPSCKLLNGGEAPEGLLRQNHSAFKPVAHRAAENLFSWFHSNNNNNNQTNNGILHSAPEDLSLGHSIPIPCDLSTCVDGDRGNPLQLMRSALGIPEPFSIRSLAESPGAAKKKLELEDDEEMKEDEENVDIESTGDEDGDEKPVKGIWTVGSKGVKRSVSDEESDCDEVPYRRQVHGVGKKRLWDFGRSKRDGPRNHSGETSNGGTTETESEPSGGRTALEMQRGFPEKFN